ncbi:unnamed protein product [Diplocarpon coronariae]
MRAALRLLRRSAGRGGGAPSATSHGRRRGLLAYSGPGDEMGPFPHGAAHSLRHADPPPGVPGRAGPRSRYVTSRYVTSRVWAPARAGCGRGGRSGNVVPMLPEALPALPDGGLPRNWHGPRRATGIPLARSCSAGAARGGRRGSREPAAGGCSASTSEVQEIGMRHGGGERGGIGNSTRQQY